MERADLSQDKYGFTIIEVIVTSTIVAVLFSFTLPALTTARDSAKSTICVSNQYQMIKGWYGAMASTALQIPRTISFGFQKPGLDAWHDVLYNSMLRAGSTSFTGGPRQNIIACPHIELQFSGPGYQANNYGYAINCRMRAGQVPGDNEGAKWNSIRMPSSYPWFTDPAITGGGAGVGKGFFGANSSSDWGIGFYHPRDLGSAAFADGHVESITRSVLAGPFYSASPESVPGWILDMP